MKQPRDQMKRKSIPLLFEAMYHGKYEVEDFLFGEIASNYEELTIKGRRVYRPNKKLKAYHGFLNTFVFEYLTINERVVFSYRKGINLRSAVMAHARSRSFLQSDLVSFFSSIDRALVKSTLLTRSAEAPIIDLDEHVERILDLITIQDMLPMGFSTSPLISNACLTGFDDELEKTCLEQGVVYTRYADDIIISGSERNAVRDMQGLLPEILNRHFLGKLRLNLGTVANGVEFF